MRGNNMQAEWITMFKEFLQHDDIVDESIPTRSAVQTIAKIVHCNGYTIVDCQYRNMSNGLIDIIGVAPVLETIANADRHETLRDGLAMIDNWYYELRARIEDLNRMDEPDEMDDDDELERRRDAYDDSGDDEDMLQSDDELRARAIRVIDLNPCLYEHKSFILTDEWGTREHYKWIINSRIDEILLWCESGDPTISYRID
jgi:hypothetical protein